MNTSLNILFEDEHIIVCKKLAGIATQSKSIRSMDLESMIKRHLYLTTRSEPYLAVIHRLDQPVSGILVFAKTPLAAKELNKQLQSRGFGKHYKALLTGTVPRSLADKPLIHYMKKDGKTNTSSICPANDPQGKKASLQYKIIANPTPEDYQLFSHCGTFNHSANTLVEITLDTGRHHQIRVQMANLGCSICGDAKYGPTNNTLTNETKNWENIALCAYKLEFQHPTTHKKMTFQL